ncbi:hypothetical protein J3A83DRAFT_4356838 [Scleroderma citrinum]
MVLTVPLIIFMDDVLGNVSKQWNKHHVVYMSNASMPCEMLEKEEAAESGVITWDCNYEEEVMVIPYDNFHCRDNPVQAEECSHGGLRCNYFCWTCKVGGTNVEKRTDKGYADLFTCGELWIPEGTLAEIKEQIRLLMLSGDTTKVKAEVSKTGTHDAATPSIIEHLLELGKHLRKCKTGTAAISENEVCAQLQQKLDVLLGGQSLDDHINPCLGMAGLNIHQDTPTEILHTILLGVVKYFWGQTVYILDKANFLGIFKTHLDSVETGGLGSTTLGANHIVHYKGSLIGWHFKSLAWVMPYLIYDLSTIGKHVVLLWHTTIENTETYLISDYV